VRLFPRESPPPRERRERLALLARWFYSSWREGEWAPLANFESAPRKLANAIARVGKGK
jgi:hypothetical protein